MLFFLSRLSCKLNHQAIMSPQKQVIKINLTQHTCGSIIIASCTAQFKFRQLRGEVIQFFPFRARLAGLGEVICGAVEQVMLGKGI